MNHIFFQFLDFVIRFLIGNLHGIFCAFWDFVIRLLSHKFIHGVNPQISPNSVPMNPMGTPENSVVVTYPYPA